MNDPDIFLIDGEGREIIFLELLDELQGTDTQLFAQADFLQQFLRLAASMAAVRPTMDYLGRLGYDLGQRDHVRNWAVWIPWSIHILHRIERCAQLGELGPSLKEYCARNADKLAGLRRITEGLLSAVRLLPLGLVHGDLRPANTGWRRRDRHLVLFDFEDIMLDVRFYDIAQVPGGPRPLLPETKSNEELAALFLDAYIEHGGEQVDMRTFLNETHIAWLSRKVNLWEYLPHEAGGPAYDHRALVSDRERRCDLLRENLSLLFESVESL